jgi:C-terminal processing protease CtpA/Prc
MRKTFFSLPAFLFLFISLLSAQKNFNYSFEKFDRATGVLSDWASGIGNGRGSEKVLSLDSSSAADGHYCARVQSPDGGFGAFSVGFPADFSGKTLTLKGYIKTEDIPKNGWCGIWIRVEGPSGDIAFDNMQSKNLNGTNQWQEYSIKVNYPADAQRIVLGGIIVGAGTAWFDNIRVFVDGKPMQDAPARVIKKFPAELDTAFAGGSKVTVGELTEQRIQDLVLLGKIWGFLKYHHPKIASGDLNWDYELFRFMKQYPAGQDVQRRDKQLIAWIESLGPLPKCPQCLAAKDKIQLAADLNWLDDPQFSPDLRKYLHQVYDHRNQDKNFYVSHEPRVGNPKFLHEDPYTQSKYPDEGYRLLALYRFWNIIQYFFPYRDIIGTDWTGVMREFVPRLINTPDALQYKLTIRELIGRIQDTHANLWMKDAELRTYFGNLRPAVQVKFIEEQAVVTDYYHPGLGPKTGLKPGDVITSIEGVPVKDIVKKKLPLYPASNMPTKLRDIAKDLLRTNTPSLHLKIQRDQKSMDVVVDCYDAAKENFDLLKDRAYNQPDSCYRLLTPEIGYLYLGNVKSDLLTDIMSKFKKTKGLVIDIRNYPSEFVVFSLGSLLHTKTAKFVYFSAGSVANPGDFFKTPSLSVGEKNADAYQGKIVVLVNEMTQSQAEYTTMSLRSVPGTVVVGSTTAGADGNVSAFSLPGGLDSMISGIGVFYPNGDPTQQVGIIPDYVVKPTIKGISAGKDELLEYAVNLIQKKK